MTRVTFLDGFDPGDMVLALFTCPTDDRQPPEFLGTGFFAVTQRTFVTAFHNLPSLETPVCVISTRALQTAIPAKLITHDANADLAVLDVQGGNFPTKPLSIYPYDNTLTGLPVKCIEFGTTRRVGAITELSQAVRVGNITRQFKHLEQFGKAGDDSLELSFPALRGASGAPILVADTLQVVGIVKANVGYELIPAQIEEYVASDGKEQERIVFMMPQAIAVYVGHLRSLLDNAIKCVFDTPSAN